VQNNSIHDHISAITNHLKLSLHNLKCFKQEWMLPSRIDVGFHTNDPPPNQNNPRDPEHSVRTNWTVAIFYISSMLHSLDFHSSIYQQIFKDIDRFRPIFY